MFEDLTASVQHAPHECSGAFEPQPLQKRGAGGTDVAKANLRSSPEIVKRRCLSREDRSGAGFEGHDPAGPYFAEGSLESVLDVVPIRKVADDDQISME